MGLKEKSGRVGEWRNGKVEKWESERVKSGKMGK